MNLEKATTELSALLETKEPFDVYMTLNARLMAAKLGYTSQGEAFDFMMKVKDNPDLIPDELFIDCSELTMKLMSFVLDENQLEELLGLVKAI